MGFLEGSNSYFLLGDDHDDWEGRSTEAIQKILPFVSEEVIPRRELYRFQQNKGNPGPGKPYPGISGVSGPIRMLLGDTHLGTILKWLTGDNTTDPATPVALPSVEMIATSVSFTPGTADTVPSGKQPKDVVPTVQVGKIKVTLDDAELATGKSVWSVKVVGTDFLGRDISETITSTAVDTAIESTKFFRIVTSITVSDVAQESGGTLTRKVEVVPDSYKKGLDLQSAIPKFKTMEMVYGGTHPISITGAVPSGAQFTFGNAIELSLDILARRAYRGQNLIGGSEKTDVSSWTNARPTGDVMVDLATILEIDGEEEYCSAINFGLNHNLGFAETKHGKRSIYEREPVRQGEFELTAGFTLDYDQSKDIDIKSYGEDLNVRLQFATAPQGGNPAILEIHAQRCAFEQIAVPPISDSGPIYQPVNLIPYGSTESTAADADKVLKVTVYSSEDGAAFI